MARVPYSDVSRWAAARELNPAGIAAAFGVSSQTLNGWRKRGQVSADESDRIAAIIGAETHLSDQDSDPDILHIPRPDTWASMGMGAPIVDHVDVVDTVRVRLSELRRQAASFTAPRNLRILAAYGDSMSPTLNDGDVLLVDCGITEVKIDAVYVLEKDEELFVKRIQRKNGTWIVLSDNKLYESYAVTDAERQRFVVRGRVVLVWNAKRL